MHAALVQDTTLLPVLVVVALLAFVGSVSVARYVGGMLLRSRSGDGRDLARGRGLDPRRLAAAHPEEPPERRHGGGRADGHAQAEAAQRAGEGVVTRWGGRSGRHRLVEPSLRQSGGAWAGASARCSDQPPPRAR